MGHVPTWDKGGTMENHGLIPRANRARFYAELLQEMKALLDADPLANLANASALLYHQLPDLNWAGFYLLRKRELVLGPFQGRTACVRIALSRGVCGAAARERRTVLVRDVHEFPGHIACDARSRSELVIPLLARGRVLGVLDLDSPRVGRFDQQDAIALERFAALLTPGLEGLL